MDDAEGDLGGDAEAEDQQNERIERDLGDRIERAEDRVGHVAGKTAQAEPKAEHDAAGNRDDAGNRKGGGRRRCGMRPRISGASQQLAQPARSSPAAKTARSAPTAQ